MSQLSSTQTSNGAVTGALLMLVASAAFGGTNVLQSYLAWPIGMQSTGMTFWQYLVATLIALPLILRIGVGNLRTGHPIAHEIRAFVSALGVHVFVYGFASGMPVWQVVALLATGPLFIVLGSTLFLRERVTPVRLVAALLGFAGALMVSGIGGDGFTATVLIPIAAAALWATTDVLTKYLTRKGESPETLTISLLVLITPNHLLILIAATLLAQVPGLLPAGIATGFPFALPEGIGLWLLVLLGVLTAVAQYFLAFAYKKADATYLQPFGDLKVPLTAVIGFIFLSQVPTIWFWVGTALIVAASLLIFMSEAGTRRQGRMALTEVRGAPVTWPAPLTPFCPRRFRLCSAAMAMNTKDTDFFKPLWRRVLVTGIVVAWCGYETFFSKDSMWITITSVALLYCVWNFFLRFPKDPPAPTPPGA